MKAFKLQECDKKMVLVAALDFKSIDPIVKFTSRMPKEWIPYEFNDDNYTPQNNEYYQRIVDSNRVTLISQYIEDELLEKSNQNNRITAIFPSSIIINFEIDEIDKAGDIIDFQLPMQNNSCLIVDGQHRFAAMRQVYKKYADDASVFGKYMIEQISEYKFNCTILINFDLWEQSQLFAIVNFNQKRVDKSLFYDIFGSTPKNERIDKNNGIYIAHELAQFLNNSPKSPLKGFIKMLGSGSPGYFSQAFLVESILIHFSNKGVWNDIELDFENKGDRYKKLPRVFIAYFSALKSVFINHWPKEGEKYKSILLKTTGVGALIRLLGLMYKHLELGSFPLEKKVNFNECSSEELEDIYLRIFTRIKDDGDELFSSTSEYAGAGSVGLQRKLYNRLKELLGFEIT